MGRLRCAHVAAIPEAVRDAGRHLILLRDVEDVARAVHQHEVVVAFDRFVCSLDLPPVPDDMGRVDDVAEPEHEGRRARSQRFERREQLTGRSMRHVVDEQDVGPEADGDTADEVSAQRDELGAGDGQRQPGPATCAGLHDGRKFQVVLVGRESEEGAERRVGDSEYAGAGTDTKELVRQRAGTPQVAEAEPVLAVDEESRRTVRPPGAL